MAPRALLGVVLVAALVPGAAEAQFRIVPQGGLYLSTMGLPSPDEAVELGKRESSLAYGLALEIGPVRLSGLRSTESEIPIEGLGCSDTGCARSTVSAATLALVVRPLPALGAVTPFVVLGGGMKRYDFTRQELENEGVEGILTDADDVTGHLGFGLDFGRGGFRGRLEAQDLVSYFDAEGIEPEFQHDLFITIAFVLGTS